MDPTALLERIRDRIAAIRRGEDTRLHYRHLAWEMEDLDEWLSKGGFLPEQWER